jgi:hypothetical protein
LVNNLPDPKPETVYKPKYNGSMRFAMILYPVWVGLFGYFLYTWLALKHPFSPEGFLAIVFGVMAVSLPFRVFREIRFEEQIIVKRYLLPDLVMEYKDVISYDHLHLDAQNKGVSLYMINHDSYEDLDKIMQRLMSARKIKLRKK